MDDPEDVVRRYAAQIRTARSLLGWTQRQLAAASCLPYRTIARIERADGRFHKRMFAVVRVALGVAGVIVIHGNEPGDRFVDRRGKSGRGALVEGDYAAGD